MAWAGFVEPMNFASSFTSLRDQEDVGGNEDVETLPDWASRQWTGAISPEFCQESFKNIGMFPLSVDVMLNKIIGSEPVVADMPAINFFVQTPVLTERQERHLNRQGISPESLDAAFLGFQQLLQLVPRSHSSQPISKRQRTFVEGGVLMTRDEMIASVLKAEEARREKAAAKVKKAKEREIQKKLREKVVTLKKIQQIEKKAARKEATVLKQAA
ncbi:hypothetical protein GN244_ATG09645 [Phytophthora infestans]|uniref:Uncharacterized protein n=1 Tax=Phytophthora infestans TaxID=4787 RepID=A0A833SSW0_PHYIN|nr:hypothetical protein GN244_ATG09645 [Phytophthora infestans]